MRFPASKFKQIKMLNPYWSAYTCFAFLIEGKGYDHQTVVRNFRKFVDKSDWDGVEEEEIIKQLVCLSGRPVVEPSGK